MSGANHPTPEQNLIPLARAAAVDLRRRGCPTAADAVVALADHHKRLSREHERLRAALDGLLGALAMRAPVSVQREQEIVSDYGMLGWHAVVGAHKALRTSGDEL